MTDPIDKWKGKAALRAQMIDAVKGAEATCWASDERIQWEAETVTDAILALLDSIEAEPE